MLAGSVSLIARGSVTNWSRAQPWVLLEPAFPKCLLGKAAPGRPLHHQVRAGGGEAQSCCFCAGQQDMAEPRLCLSKASPGVFYFLYKLPLLASETLCSGGSLVRRREWWRLGTVGCMVVSVWLHHCRTRVTFIFLLNQRRQRVCWNGIKTSICCQSWGRRS